MGMVNGGWMEFKFRVEKETYGEICVKT